MQDCDVHFFAALLKNYLRELPIPLLGRKEGHVHDRWIEVPGLPNKEARVKEIRYILKEELTTEVVTNIQYLIKMLAELTKKSDVNKMTTSNLSIVIGPSLLWKTGGGAASQQNNIEKVIKVVSMLVEHYAEIFPIDLHWQNYDEGITDILEQVRQIPIEVKTPTRTQTREKSPKLPKQMSSSDEKKRPSSKFGLSRFKN